MLTREDFEFRKTYRDNNTGTVISCAIRPLARRMNPAGFDTLASHNQHVEQEMMRAAWEHVYGDVARQLEESYRHIMGGVMVPSKGCSSLLAGDIEKQFSKLIEMVQPPLHE